MGTISLQIPQIGVSDTTEDVKVANNFTALQTAINGNLDSTNLLPAAAQSAGVNQSGQTVKGAVNIATSESRTNVAFGTMPTPDQVTGLVVPANGIVQVRYQATWSSAVAAAGQAAIFIGANQLVAEGGSTAPTVTQANTSGTVAQSLAAFQAGLASTTLSSAYTGDVSTGQALGIVGDGNGLCEIFGLPAGTYTVSVQFKASSGSVTVSNRKLWVMALSFA